MKLSASVAAEGRQHDARGRELLALRFADGQAEEQPEHVIYEPGIGLDRFLPGGAFRVAQLERLEAGSEVLAEEVETELAPAGGQIRGRASEVASKLGLRLLELLEKLGGHGGSYTTLPPLPCQTTESPTCATRRILPKDWRKSRDRYSRLANYD